MELNPPYATSDTRSKWAKIGLEVLKYAIGAVLGGLGITFAGCSCVPVFTI